MSDTTPQSGTPAGEALAAAAAAQSLHEDLKVAYWILVSAARSGVVRGIEAEALVRSLYTTLHARAQPTLPLFDVPHPGIYAVAHAVNVALTTMAVAEQLGFGETEARALGIAGLLKDIGQGSIKPELLGRTVPLTSAEIAEIRRHPIDGARMLIETDEPLELAAVVAYEHHLGPDGSGYPSLAHPRPVHFASRLVRVIDVFCALYVRRPHRDASSFEDVLAHIAKRAGIEFDRNVTTKFLEAMRRLEPHIVRLVTPEQKLPWVE